MKIFLLGLFLLSEPQPIPIQKIGFIGNHNIKAKTLKKVIRSKEKTPYDSLKVIEDINALLLFYQGEGFRETEVKESLREDTIKKRVDLIFYISEGKRIKIYKINLSGVSKSNEKELFSLIGLKEEDYLIERRLQETGKRIVQFYRNRGYPYVKVEKEVVEQENSALVNFKIGKGPLIYIMDVKIEGNKSVKSKSLIGIAGLKIGEKFSEKRVYKAQQRLYATRLFSYVGFHISKLKQREDGVTLIFEVRELSSRIFGLGIGGEIPSRLLLSLQWEHLNLFSSAHLLSLTANISPDISNKCLVNFDTLYRTIFHDYRFNFNTFYCIPNIYGLSANFSIRPFYNSERREDYFEKTWGVEGGLNKEISPELQFSLLSRYKLVSISSSDSTLLDRKGVTNSIILNSLYDTRDEFFSPTKGLYFNLLLEKAGGFLKGNNDFYRISPESRFFISFLNITLALRIKGGCFLPYGRTSPDSCEDYYYELFTLGGRNSLRGYPDRSIGDVIIEKDDEEDHYGRFLANNNFEIRFPIYRNLRGVLFFDGGNLVSNGQDLNKNYQFSIGVGLRFNTVIGPLRLDYGRRLKGSPQNFMEGLYFGIFESF